MTTLFDSYHLGHHTLANRLVMAPLTRSRAQFDGTPGELAAQYYAERAGVGLIITEATQPSDDGQGYMATSGIYNEAHIAGWKKITDAVHAKGTPIFIQLMHAGRIAHPDNTPHRRQALAPSAIEPGSPIFTPKGMQAVPMPREMTVEEIHQTVADFGHAARCAIEAGADGVEIHAANAYLIHQFLAPSSNKRTDAYGGSIENRARFAIDVAKAIAGEIGADRTAIRLSPGMNLWGIEEGPDAADLYRYLVAELDTLALGYLHITQYSQDEALLSDFRKLWKSTLILNRPGRPREQIGSDIASGLADLEAYGKMVLANPDFVKRLKTDAPMNAADPSTFFGGDAHGYTDYPTLVEAQGV
ncbi:alkene reductase [Pseudomonas amygdali]|uniref:alkene reductase n=1 Tax=Pseudomonas amygdali TaxID=47877 RepID=UPI001CD8D93A|nr:alkene reductase [Pseudomonas amygdali]UBT80451.1 alkene reductase [Pseudomonas amygdali]